MIPYPPVAVHGLIQAEAALIPGLPVTLLSAPFAACNAGCGWWRALIAEAQRRHPGTPCADILDCGDAPGRALEAVRAGQRLLILLPCPAFESAREAAEAAGSIVLSARPESLDLARVNPATGFGKQKLENWLRGTVTRPAS